MPDSEAKEVFGPSGLVGYVLRRPGEDASEILVTRLDGTEVSIRASSLQMQADGSYFLASSGDENISQPAAHIEEIRVPVIAEELVVEKHKVPTGGVRVHKIVQQHDEVIAMPLLKEHVDIRRVIVDRDVPGPMPIRYEGDVTIIPVVEEVIVVEKRMRLKEEFHITRRRTEEHTEQTVTLQRETAVVERLDAQGRGTVEDIPAQTAAAADVAADPKRRPPRRNRIIPEE